MEEKTITVQSPGRINIIGEHTDYNDGYVLPAAIDKKSTFRLTKNGALQKVNIYADNIGDHFSFDLDNFSPIENGWENYIMGVILELQKMGAKLEGFDGHLFSDVPIGGGMSSSAALVCSLAQGLNILFDLHLDNWQLIKACQRAEQNFVGIRCGVMDQFASVMGKKNHAMLLDCRSFEFNYIPFDLGNYELLLLNTNVSHALASSEYNTRREECESGVEILKNSFPEIKNLRDVSLVILDQCQQEMPENIYRRCHHVISENQRVLNATDALLKNDFNLLGELIYESHLSLKLDYEVSCAELDFLVDLTVDKHSILGSRMMGGGFGGCTLNLIENNQADNFIEFANKAYQKAFGKIVTAYSVTIENGSRVVLE